MHIEASIESISFDGSNDRNLTSNVLNLASFAPKHHDDRLFTEASMDLEMGSAIFSDFLYFFYLDMLQKEVGLLIPFTKRGKQLNLAQFLVIPFMSKEMGIHKRDFLQLLRLNTARTVLLKNFQHLIQML